MKTAQENSESMSPVLRQRPGLAKAHVDSFLKGIEQAPTEATNLVKATKMVADASDKSTVKESLQIVLDLLAKPLNANLLKPLVSKVDKQHLAPLLEKATSAVYLKASAALNAPDAFAQLQEKLGASDLAEHVKRVLETTEEDFPTRLVIEVNHGAQHNPQLTNALLSSHVHAAVKDQASTINLSNLRRAQPIEPGVEPGPGLPPNPPPSLPYCEGNIAQCGAIAVVVLVVVILVTK